MLDDVKEVGDERSEKVEGALLESEWPDCNLRKLLNSFNSKSLGKEEARSNTGMT
jgi:hypothetical protein